MCKKISVVGPVLLCFALLTSCSTDKKPETAYAKVFLGKIDSEFVKTASIGIAQLKASDSFYAGDERRRLKTIIREYEAAGTDVQKKATIAWGSIYKDDDPKAREAALVADNLMAKFGWFLRNYQTTIVDNNFDLAVMNNDAAVQQIKTLNSYYHDAGKETMDAVAYYEKLSKLEKIQMLNSSSRLSAPGTFNPNPQQLLSQRLLQGYLAQRLLLQQNVTRFITYRMQAYYDAGMRTNFSQAAILKNADDKAFDLYHPTAKE
jgi:hypothetical protein